MLTCSPCITVAAELSATILPQVLAAHAASASVAATSVETVKKAIGRQSQLQCGCYGPTPCYWSSSSAATNVGKRDFIDLVPIPGSALSMRPMQTLDGVDDCPDVVERLLQVPLRQANRSE